ncbi:MAG: ATP-binding protein [Burkholderiaceae bacterium]
MIDALIELAKISREPLAPQPFDLSSAATSIFAELRARDPQRRVQAIVQPGIVSRGDPVLLRLVLQNLIGNAWKFTSTRDEAKIVVDARPGDHGTIYRVCDNGVGFDMSFADQIFGIFQRVHSQSLFPGTGIGLATTQRIIRRHHGRIWANAASDQGASFEFTLWDEVVNHPARLH